MYKTLALALAAVASALPAPQSDSSIPPPTKAQEFSLAMEVEGSLVALTAVDNGTVGNKVLQAGRLSVYTGSPAYLNNSPGGTSALNFALDDGVYGIGLPEVGDNYGYAASAFAIYNYQQFEWSVNNGTVDHKRDAALNSFFACQESLPAENYYLKWGTESSDGQPPAGCQFTKVVQNFNIEGGATPTN